MNLQVDAAHAARRPKHFRLTPEMRRTLVAFGALRSVIVVTLISIVLSMSATALIVPLNDETRFESLMIALVIPVLVAPVVSGIGFGLVMELDSAWKELDALASTDDLTQLLNRRAFAAQSRPVLDQLRESGRPCAVILFDLDEFKRINDSVGHAAGDYVLQRVAQLCSSVLRQGDLFARYGGDEFVLLLPDTDEAAATALAESLNKVVHAVPATLGSISHLRPTITVGVAVSPQSHFEVGAMLAVADAALLEAKRTGRDRVLVKRM